MSLNWSDLKLLVVEDSADMRLILVALLKKKGARVFAAEHGQAALDILAEQAIDMIVSDIQMPVMDGVEFLKEVRTRHPQDPPLLFVTGQTYLTEEEALASGASGLIQKPFSFTSLVEKVEILILNHLGRGI